MIWMSGLVWQTLEKPAGTTGRPGSEQGRSVEGSGFMVGWGGGTYR